MFKTLVAGVTAISLTLASAQPAQARGLSEDDVGKLLFGLVAALAVGAAIKDHNDRPRESTNQHAQRSHDYGDRHSNAGRTHRSNPAVLPRECLRRVSTNFGEHRVFGRRCLRNNYNYTADLPRQCAVRLYTDRGPVRGFDPRCLREQGFRARRH